MDIVGRLPAEISLEVLKYLLGEDLARCSGVSLRWRSLTNNSALWKRICIIEDIDINQPIPSLTDILGQLEPPCDFKRLYYTHGSLLQKWRSNKYRTLDLENIIGTAYFENDTVLAAMYWDGCVEVFTLKGTPRVIQSIPALSPRGLVTFAARNGELAVMRCNGVFLFYRWHEGELQFWQGLYSQRDGWGGVDIRSTESREYVHSIGEETSWELKALMGEIVVFYVREDQTLYLWSLQESKCISIVPFVRNPKCSVYGDHMFVCSPEDITAYNARGQRKFSFVTVRLGCDIRNVDLHFNQYTVLGVLNCSQGFSLLKAWDWRWRQRAEIREKLHGLALHPRLPAAVYLSQYGKHRCDCRIIMRDLIERTILWETPFHTSSPFGTIKEDFCFFSIIKENYFLCVPRYESDFTSDQLLLYNLKDGKQIYHVKNNYQFSVNHSNDKFIEVIVYKYRSVYWATRFMLYN